MVDIKSWDDLPWIRVVDLKQRLPFGYIRYFHNGLLYMIPNRRKEFRVRYNVLQMVRSLESLGYLRDDN